MKKFGFIVIAILVGTILYEIFVPPFNPQWLRLLIEIAVIIVFGFIGLAVFKSTDKKSVEPASE